MTDEYSYITREVADLINRKTYTLTGKRPEPSEGLMDLAREIYDLVSKYDDINRPPAEPEDLDFPDNHAYAFKALDDFVFRKQPNELLSLNYTVTWRQAREALDWLLG